MARKAALDNMPVACCNRRGFPAGKRVHFGPPLPKKSQGQIKSPAKRVLIWEEKQSHRRDLKSEISNRKLWVWFRRYGGLAQLGERLPCKQEVTGSIPVLSTKRLTEIPWKWGFIESLEKVIQRCTLKTEHCELLMQLWEGNSKGKLFN